MTNIATSTVKIALGALALSATLLASCGRDPENTGTEYASQMYHPIAYEDYTQIVDTTTEDYNSNPYNPHRQNMRKPARHTIARKNTSGQSSGLVLARDIMEYNIPSADSLAWSARNLRNPYPATEKVLVEGKILYGRYCAHCHGADGKGDGKVATMYKGVANLTTGAVARANEGHVYHVITHGKGRMWPHGPQILPEDRWKIVSYVKTLQGGTVVAGAGTDAGSSTSGQSPSPTQAEGSQTGQTNPGAASSPSTSPAPANSAPSNTEPTSK